MANLHEAALEGNVSVVSKHLSAGAAVNEAQATAFTNDRTTALHVASENGNLACVQQLIAHGARVDLQDLWGHTALHLAAQEGHTAIVEVRPCDFVGRDHIVHSRNACGKAGMRLHLTKCRT
jgi:ankyrin repeat protein